MARRFSTFIYGVLGTHVGHVLLAISWSFILFVWVQRPLAHSLLVDCTPTREELFTITEVLRVYPIYILVTALAHLPATLLTAGVTKIIQVVFSLSCGPTAKLEVPLVLFFSAIQWLLMGYMIETFVRWARSRA
jgi:hypothetical protein